MPRQDGQAASAAALAAYDAASARAFGRQVAEAAGPPAWRTGPVGELTSDEYDLGSGLAFGRFTGAQEAQVRRQVAATDQQLAVERQLLREASANGWDALRTRYSGEDAVVVESVRNRLGGGSSAQLRESAGAALLSAGMRVNVREATAVVPTKLVGRKIRVTLITPGQGTSGWYPAETLQQAATDRVFGKGLHLYLDHPSATEAMDRPERSVRDLAGVLTSDATWNGSALVAEAEVFPQFADLVSSLAGVIGMSIRAQGDVEPTTVGGQPVRKITRLVNADSCDFVTRAGRGGSYEVLESRRTRWGS